MACSVRSSAVRHVLLLVALILTAGGAVGPTLAQGQQPNRVWTVCPEGKPDCDFRSIQDALTAAVDGDLIKVTGDVFEGVEAHTVPPGYPSPPADGILYQAVYVDKSVTIRGGYDDRYTEPPDPVSNPTILAVREQGRGLVIAGDVRPVVEGLLVYRGLAYGLGGAPGGRDAGGGIYVLAAAPTLRRNTVVYGQSMGNGAGAYLYHSAALLEDNVIRDCWTGSDGQGGGMYLWASPATLRGNLIHHNHATAAGGGLALHNSAAEVSNNLIEENNGRPGGGLYLENSTAQLTGNTVRLNESNNGAGMALAGSRATLTGNTVRENKATVIGGGLHLSASPATLAGNTIADNRAHHAGGLYLLGSKALLSGNEVTGNTGANGSGILLEDSPAIVTGNLISGNQAWTAGGGLHLRRSAATLDGNQILGNEVLGPSWHDGGGGLFLEDSPALLRGNTISGNKVGGNPWYEGSGGGIRLWQSDATLQGNSILDNQATVGGGLDIGLSQAWLENNLVADNRATVAGSGLAVAGSTVRLVFTTIAANGGPAGDGVSMRVDYENPHTNTVVLTNTIIASQTVGISAESDMRAVLRATLWGGGEWANGQDWGGAGTIVTGTVNVWADPAFVDPARGDYHLRPGSPALDAGIDGGVKSDIDGDPRPQGPGYDLGADEWLCLDLPAPRGLRPADGGVACGPRPGFAWGPLPGAALYELQVADEDGFAAPLWTATTADPFYRAADELAPASYRWRVRAINPCQTGPWSRRADFALVECDHSSYLPFLPGSGR